MSVVAPRSPAPGPRWRPEDEALCQRLLDEEVLEALWRIQAPPGAEVISRRAAVLVREARAVSGGSAAVELAMSGHVAVLADWLASSDLSSWPGGLLHAVAVYFARLAGAWASVQTEQAPRTMLNASVRSLTAWLALGRGEHLVDLARGIANGAIGEDALRRLASQTTTRAFEQLGTWADKGARELTPTASAALAALRRAPDACRAAGLDTTEARPHLARAQSLRDAAVDDALGVVRDALADAKTADAPTTVYGPLFTRVAAVWEWSERDVHVEHFAVDEITPMSWDLCRRSAWGDLRDLLAPCVPLFESLEARVLASPADHLAYAAKCAQVLVFRSEAELDARRELAFAERSLRVCPTHRNGRVVLAHLLANRAITLLDRTNWLSARNDLAEAEQLLARAESTFADSTRLKDARTKFAEAKQRWGAAT
ncbi:MAG: hypothetical protein U0271_21865 [Polyangiaceae bacterium]